MWFWTPITVPVFNVSEMGLVFFQRWSLQYAERGHASPSSFQEINPNLFCWRGSSQVERYRESSGANKALCFFSWVTSWKDLWMDISSLSSPSLTHCGPNLLKHMSRSVVYPSLESVPTRRGCILWLCRRMGLLREGSIFNGCSCEGALIKPEPSWADWPVPCF